MELGKHHQRQVRALLSKTGFGGKLTVVDIVAGTSRNYTIGGWGSANIINDKYVLFYPRLDSGGTLTVVDIVAGTSQNYTIGG